MIPEFHGGIPENSQIIPEFHDIIPEIPPIFPDSTSIRLTKLQQRFSHIPKSKDID